MLSGIGKLEQVMKVEARSGYTGPTAQLNTANSVCEVSEAGRG